MNELVTQRLHRLEEEEGNGFRVLLAVEEGSRAWGLSSNDSDYDVRFVYVRGPQHYLSIHQPKRETISFEDPSIPADFCGWDVRKMVALLHESNPSLLDWLRSPTYIDCPIFTSTARELAKKNRSRRALTHHYISVAKKHHSIYFEDKTDHALVPLKKYIYVLRPLLCVKWLSAHPAEHHEGLPPIDFEVLSIDTNSLNDEERQAVTALIEKKRSGKLQQGERIPVLDALIQRLFEEARGYINVATNEDIATGNNKTPPTDEYDKLVCSTVLSQCWCYQEQLSL